MPAATLRPLPPRVTVFYNASSNMTSKRLGGLAVRVKRQVRPDGTSVTTVTYERSKPCHEEGGPGGNYFVACPVVWRKTQRLTREEQFTIDLALLSAALTDTLQGKRLTVRWTAVGAPLPPRVNENGNLYSDMRQATSSGTWGDWTHNHPPEGGPGVLLSRRVPSP